MDKAKEVITRKVGPLPVWAWVAIGAAVVFVLRARSGGGALPVGNPFGQGDAASGGSVSGPTLAAPLSDVATPLATTLTQPDFPTTGTVAGPSTVIPTAETPSLTEQPIASPAAYKPPSLNPPSVPAAGGSIYASPATQGVFAQPFVSPLASTVTTAGETPYAQNLVASGQIPSNAQIQLIGGVPISLSAEAVARGGVPGIDIPLASGQRNSATGS